ncbi:hypothetical protein EB151_03890 [archaeon]|nr:hypothetical protein [archaeon]
MPGKGTGANVKANDTPSVVIPTNLSTSFHTTSLMYPSNAGTTGLHSHVLFAITNTKPIQHVKAGFGLKHDAGNIHTAISLYIPEQISVTHDVAYKQDESRGAAALAA